MFMQVPSHSEELRLQIMNSNHRKQIVDLRKEAFAAKYGSRIDLKGLEWNEVDEVSVHFGAFSGSELVSALRLSRLNTKQEFQKILQFSPDHSFAVIPAFSFARAATAEKFRQCSLNMRLRIEAFKYVMARPGDARFIYGTMLAHSRRLPKLESLGYEILIHQENWKGYLDSQNEAIAIFRLPVEKLSGAVSRLEQELKPGLRKGFLSRFFQ